MRMLFIFIIFFKVIPIPAWLVLLWWFFWQVIAALPELKNGADLSGGVAVWAHVGGFLTGVLLVKLFENRQLVVKRGPCQGRFFGQEDSGRSLHAYSRRDCFADPASGRKVLRPVHRAGEAAHGVGDAAARAVRRVPASSMRRCDDQGARARSRQPHPRHHRPHRQELRDAVRSRGHPHARVASSTTSST